MINHTTNGGNGKGGVSLNLDGVEREELEVDVLLVGAGPATLSCAIQLQKLAEAKGLELSVLLIEKAEDIGYHTLSGAVMDPRAIRELIGDDWKEQGCPTEGEVTFDCVDWLTGSGKVRLKGPFVPPQFKNHGNHIISLYQVVRWLKDRAEGAGVEVYPGFAAASVRYDGERVVGVQTRDAGISKSGEKKGHFEPGMNIVAKVTVFGEGTRGHLAKGLIDKLGLAADKNPQVYETGIKEIWSIPAGREMFGKVIHTAGQPLGTSGYGGGWIYGLKNDRLSIGYVVGLDQGDAKLDPHAMFVKWKQHPEIAKLLEGGKVERYGAKTIPGGGYYSMPKLQGDGFVIVGDSAGFVNMSRLKGIHLAMKSGMLAAEALVEALAADDTSATKLARYTELFEASWAKQELYKVRNFRQAFAKGFLTGSIDAGVQMVTGGRGLVARRTMSPDHEHMQRVANSTATKPRYDDGLSLDKLTDVYHSGAVHEEDQPSHLVVTDPDICVTRCTEEYGNPCKDFCPAAVYEWPHANAGDAKSAGGVVINASNCVHCKTCDVADPYQVIEWTVPEGGGGPKYIDM
ncbi:Electron transfer flavoprotein-ubiquinone oxidoreductase [Planctomycetes bacterium Pla163]|uniref:Electron transfer flavoprotein-ubiquinone oxidoreductase n=1 Tax=Rohdeia mirabilis TaxID=2528008 RepID=A0A518D121_9BACT|nr:Electron transfer flavoprotein-ubiquinone oxidoreductase [Planctomycetes bacterium Pla163]